MTLKLPLSPRPPKARLKNVARAMGKIIVQKIMVLSLRSTLSLYANMCLNMTAS